MFGTALRDREAELDSLIALPESAPPARCWVRMVVRNRSANAPNNDGNGTSVRRQKHRSSTFLVSHAFGERGPGAWL